MLTRNGRLGQWGGIEFVCDPTFPAQTFSGTAVVNPGQRIREAVVTKANGTRVTLVANGVLVAPTETFWFVTNDFTFRGGDNYPLTDVPFTTLGLTYQQALAERVESLGTITAANYPDLTVLNNTYRRFGPEGASPSRSPDRAGLDDRGRPERGRAAVVIDATSGEPFASSGAVVGWTALAARGSSRTPEGPQVSNREAGSR